MESGTLQRQRTMTVMQQIEDLKNWHKQQEKLLKKDHLQNQRYTNKFTTKRDNEVPILNSNESNLSDSLKIPSTFNEVNNSKFYDEIPIKPSHSDFNQLLDFKMDASNGRDIGYENNGSKPKRKFLKKGEGLARFRMPPKDMQVRKSKPAEVKQSNREINSTGAVANISNKDKLLNTIVKDTSRRKQIVDENYITSDKLSTKVTEETIPFNWKSILSSMLAPNQNNYFNPENSIQTDSSNHSLPDSFLEKITAVGKKNVREGEEIKVFEMLEQHALDSSFCSSSSMIMHLMENSIKSTPIKESSSTIEEKLPSKFYEGGSVQFEKNIPGKCDSHTEKQNSEEQPSNQLDQSVHVRFREENSYRSFIDYSDPTYEESKIVKQNYYGDDKQWSEEDCECSCSTEYSSSDEDTRPISPPDVPSRDQQNIVTVQIKSSGKKVGDIILNTVDQNSKPLEAIECTSTKMLEVIENEKPDENIESRNELQDLMSNCGKKLQQSSELPSQSSIINLRLQELEDEIEIFRKENAKLKKLHSDFEHEYKLFKNDQKLFNLQIEEERRKNSEFLEEEKQKIAKEKLVFEKYTKNLIKNPNKVERKEIQILKEQLAALKEELMKKESRWGAAQARVRNQVKLLEDDNKKLKQEIEDIRKQSQKVNMLKNERKSNTHLLHTISQQLTKISPRDLAESLDVKDIPKPMENKQKLVKYKKNKRNKQPNKILCENLYEAEAEDLLSGSESENSDSVHKKNSLESEIKKTIEEAMFEPVMNALKMKDKISHQNLMVSDSKNLEEPMNEDSIKLVVETDLKRMSDPKPEDIIEETTNQEGNREIHYTDGRKEIRYKNGNLKKISPNGDIIKIVYFNGDVKEICKDGKVKYYYGESRTWHTTYPDGLEVLDFPNGQVERRHLNGTIEILYPNECKKFNYTDGSEEWIYKDGTVLKIDAEKQKILIFPNGQKEIHTKEHKRREYPDGTVKLMYPDGTQETRYSNGRIRLKDKDGYLVMDSG